MYYIYSIPQQGWWNGINFSSDVASALETTEDQALVRCLKAQSIDGDLSIFPVPSSLIKDLLK